MKENWTYKKLGEICEITMGQSPVGTSINANDGIEFHQGKVFFGDKFLSPSNVYTNAPTKLAEAHSLLLCVRAPVGIINITERPICIGRGLCSISSHCDVNSIFVYYALLAKQQYFEKNSTGSTFKAISSNIVKNTPIPVPPLSEQQSIVRELDLLNDLIAKKRAQVAEYDQLQQSLFYTMFGDPVTNEKGWEVKKLGEVAIATTGITYSPDDVSDKGTVVLRSSNIQENLLDFSDVVRVNKEIKDKYIAKEGDILMCSRNGSFRLVGKTAKITGLQETMTWGAFMTIIRSDYNPYLLQYFRSPAFREQLTTAKTTTVNQITIGMLNAVSFPLPPLPLQQEFAKKVEAIEALKAKVNDSIRETETLLASRMDYYFG